MASEKDARIRLKWPNGAEFEAEGSAEFVAREGREFLLSLEGARTPAAGGPRTDGAAAPALPDVAWEQIFELDKGRTLQLRGKLPADKTERDACLVLLIGAAKRLHEPKPTATQLAKWLRRSGYPVGRMDRALQDAVTQGEILASGARRARRYELTSAGRLKALLLAEALSRSL